MGVSVLQESHEENRDQGAAMSEPVPKSLNIVFISTDAPLMLNF